MSQEHGIGLGETSGTVDFLGCFLWTGAQGRVPFVCESIGGEDAQSPLLKEEIGLEASRDCQNLVAGAGQEHPRLGPLYQQVLPGQPGGRKWWEMPQLHQVLALIHSPHRPTL